MGIVQPALRDRVIEVLRDLVRIDTTNPPGNETACAVYLSKLLAPVGIETRIVESAPGRGNLIARLRGSGVGKPLMLMGHLDVVSADSANWTHAPFAADIADGFMWGRGTTDMKQMVAASAVVMLALAASEQPLKRDVLFCATADEEHGGRYGMGWLAKEMPALFDVACALNEGGGSPVRVNGQLYYTCQTAEKGLCRTVWTARAQGGHASRPSDDISTLRLARAMAQMGDGHLGGVVIDTMRQALCIMAGDQPTISVAKVEKLLDQGQVEKAMKVVGFDAADIARTRCLFYDTASITGLRAGDPQSINVIPPTATAYVDGRILPGQTQDGFISSLRQRVGADVEIEVYRRQFSAGLEASPTAPIVDTISQVIADRCQGAKVIPWQCAGSTDAKNLAVLNVPVYGFVPSKPLPEGVIAAGAHANDERIWLDNVPFALETLYDIAYRFCVEI